MIVKAGDLRVLPTAVVKIGGFKSDLGGGGVVFFQKLRVIARLAGLPIAAMRFCFEGFVARQHGPAIGHEVENETVAVIAALPHAVDQSLIERVHGDDVAPRPQVGRNVHAVVIVAEMIGGRGPLRHKRAVDIEFIVIVGRDKDLGVGRHRLQFHGAAKQNMPVPVLVAGQFYLFQLFVKHLAGREVAKLPVGDPTARKLVHFRAPFRFTAAFSPSIP